MIDPKKVWTKEECEVLNNWLEKKNKMFDEKRKTRKVK